MADSIDPNADIIDSRDIIARLEELAERDTDIDLDLFPVEPLDDDERAELESLRDLARQGETCAEDWQYGAALIADSYFTDYAQQLADDIGAIPRDAGWPTSYIDWDAAAAALQTDYSSIIWENQTFWVR